MEKKQLFDSSLVGFHPNIFIPFLELNINIDNYNIFEEFTIEKDIALDDNFIDIYNKIEKGDFCSISINITNNNNNSTIILPGYKGTTGLYFRDVVILQISNRTTITNLNFANIDTSSKTASIVFIRKIISQSDSDNTIVKLTTTINGLTDLIPGDFNETVTLTAEEYNAFNEVSIGEIFMLVNTIDSTSFLAFKIGNNSFRVNRDYINDKLSNRSLVSFLIELGENNQATFKGNVTELMNPDNYLAKDNTTKYIPTSDYNPATKKYVDDLVSWTADLMHSVRDFDLTDDIYTINVIFNAINRTDYVFLTQIATMNINNTNVSFDVIIYKYNNSPSLDDRYIIVAPDQIKVNNSIYNIKYIKNNTTTIGIQFTKIQQILTESEYAALGTTPNTNDVLYFITPD